MDDDLSRLMGRITFGRTDAKEDAMEVVTRRNPRRKVRKKFEEVQAREKARRSMKKSQAREKRILSQMRARHRAAEKTRKARTERLAVSRGLLDMSSILEALPVLDTPSSPARQGRALAEGVRGMLLPPARGKTRRTRRANRSRRRQRSRARKRKTRQTRS